MHLMPKNGNHGCFAPTCGLEHAHDYTTYSCFDFDNPTCGKEIKLQEVTCFTEEALEAIIQFILQGRKAAFQLIGPLSPCHGAVGGLFIQKHLMHADGLIGHFPININAEGQLIGVGLNRHQLAGIFRHAGNGCQKALIFHGQAKIFLKAFPLSGIAGIGGMHRIQKIFLPFFLSDFTQLCAQCPADPDSGNIIMH